MKTALEKVATEQLAEQESLVAMLFEINPNSKEYLEAKAKLEEMTNNLVAGVEKDLENAIGPGRDLIMEWILGKHAKGSINTTWTDESLRENVINDLMGTFQQLLDGGGVSSVEIEAMNLIGFTGWDLLAEDLQKKIIQYSVLRPDTMQALKDELKLDASTVISMSGWEAFEEREKLNFINSLAKVYGPSAMGLIKGQIGEIKVNDLIKISGWEQWSKEEQAAYIESLKSVYGSAAVQSALWTLGGNVPKWIADGMQKSKELKKALENVSKLLKEAGIEGQDIINAWALMAPGIDESNMEQSLVDLEKFIKESGYDINTIIRNWKFVAPSVSGLSIETSLVAIERIVQTTGLDINTILKNWNLISPNIDSKNIDSSVKFITDTINSNRSDWETKLGQDLTVPAIKVPNGWGNNVKESIDVIARYMQESLEGINPTINVKTVLSAIVNVTANIETAQGKIINTAASGAIKIQDTLTSAAKKLGWYGSGAYDIPNGQIFVAGEDGPELIGTMNGNTTVANQGQIIEGIAAGVAASNEEQNVLLREQNNLLRQILQKDTSVRLGASSALGRTVRKSLDMYNMATGEA